MDETDEVLVGDIRDAALFVGRPISEPHGGVRIPVRLVAPQVTASGALELEPWSGGIGRLPSFFDDLASHWSGWSEPKEWRDDGGTVAMTATHDRKSLVTIRVVLREYAGLPGWQVEFDIQLEPGQLQSVAEDIKSLVC